MCASTPYFKMVEWRKYFSLKLMTAFSQTCKYLVCKVTPTENTVIIQFSLMLCCLLNRYHFKTYDFSFLSAHLQPFSNCLQKVRDDGVVPQVSKPNSWTIYIYWTREEEPWTWKGEYRYYTQIIMTWIKTGSNNNLQFSRERSQGWENKRSYLVKCSHLRVQKSYELTSKTIAFKVKTINQIS